MSTEPVPYDIQRKRQGLGEVFDALEKVADERADNLLLLTTTALRTVHGLYPEADTLRLRGTPEHLARIDIHNAIADVLNAYLSQVPARSTD